MLRLPALCLGEFPIPNFLFVDFFTLLLETVLFCAIGGFAEGDTFIFGKFDLVSDEKFEIELNWSLLIVTDLIDLLEFSIAAFWKSY